MDKIEKGIAAFILLGSLLTLAFEPPWIDLRQFGARPVQSIRSAVVQDIRSQSVRICFSKVPMEFLVTGSQ
jgi:hypothetical protein